MVTPVIRSPRLAGAAVLFVAWLTVLLALVLTTSNPVVLNRAQLRAAPHVVMARVTDLPAGRCDVERQWRTPTTATALTIVDLHETGARTGQSYLFALQPANGEAFAIVPAGKERAAKPIYPATPESIARLEELLGE